MKQVLALVVAALGCWPAPARAQHAAVTEARTAPVDSRPVLLRFNSDDPAVSAESVRAALAAELGVSVIGADDPEAANCTRVLTVTLRALTKELSVTYAEAGKASVTRVISAPEKSEQVPSKAALLAGSLSRNEAQDWAPPTTTPAGAEPTPATTNETEPESLPAANVEMLPRPAAPEARVRRIANAAFFYPLATNFELPDIETNFDFNLLYGHIGALEGIGVGTVSVIGDQLRGLSISLLTSLVGRDVHGVQLASAYNSSGGELSGFQLAGLANHARGAFSGGQLAFGTNVAGASSEGLQAALGANFGAGLTGVQAGGVANLSTGAVRGAQIAFGLNYARDVEGLQLSLINIGRHVRGAQIGLFNIADDVDGVPIGLVSVTRSGGIHPMLWAATSSYANVGVKFATRYTYTFLNLSVRREAVRSSIGPGFGLGVNFPLLPSTFGAVDFGGTHLFGATVCCHEWFFGATARQHDTTLFRLRGLLRYQFLPHLSAFAGAAAVAKLQYPLDDDADTVVHFALGPEAFGGVEF
jgi:hypothetical protein